VQGTADEDVLPAASEFTQCEIRLGGHNAIRRLVDFDIRN
jgi:hypothetical protein